MAQKIYKLILIQKFTEAWQQLTKAEQEHLMAKDHEALEKVGGKQIVVCNSRWSTKQWPFFGVEEFPDIAAEQKHTQLLNEFDWFRYVDAMTVLGTEWQPL